MQQPPPDARFDRIMTMLLPSEGAEYVPHDPVLPSKWGVRKDKWDEYIKRTRKPNKAIRDLTADDARGVYYTMFWKEKGLDKYPPGPDYAALDFLMNSGINVFEAEHIVVDFSKQNPHEVIDMLCAKRLARMERSPDWKKMKKGWTARVERVRRTSHLMADGK